MGCAVTQTIAQIVVVEHGWEAAAARRWVRAGAQVVALTTEAAQALEARRLPCLLAEDALSPAVDLWARQAAERFAGIWHRVEGDDLSVYRGVSLGEMLRLPLIEALAEALRSRAALETIIREHGPSAVAAVRPLDLSSLGAHRVALNGWRLRMRRQAEALRPAALRLAKQVGLSGLVRLGRLRTRAAGRMRPARPGEIRALLVMESLGALAASLWPVLEEIERRGEIEARLFTGSLHVARRLAASNLDFVITDTYLPRLARQRLAPIAREQASRLHLAAAAQAARGVLGMAEIWDTAGPILSGVVTTLLPECLARVEAVRRALAQEKPDVVLMASAAHPLGYAFSAAGQLAGAPTVEITHGIPVMEYAYLPVRTDKVAVWGPAMRDWYAERGTDPARIAITGQPRFDRIGNRRPADGGRALRKQIGVPAGAPIVTLATNPVSDQENARLLRAVVAAMRGFRRHHLVIKMHPAERGEVQRRVASECGCPASVVQAVDLHQLIAASDALLTYHSTVGLEAMILDTPVVVINLSGLPDPAPYVERGAALGASDEAEIVSALYTVLETSDRSRALAEARRRFVADYAGEVDGGAASRVVDLMCEIGGAARASSCQRLPAEGGVRL